MQEPAVEHRRPEAGLTIIELVIAVAIIGVLATVAIPQCVGYRERAQVAQVVAEMRTIETGLERHRTEFGRLPNELASVVDPVPDDPWGNAYEYLNINLGDPGVAGKRRKDKNLVPINSDYNLYSKGPDGDSQPALTAPVSHGDIVRANDGSFMGRAKDY